MELEICEYPPKENERKEGVLYFWLRQRDDGGVELMGSRTDGDYVVLWFSAEGPVYRDRRIWRKLGLWFSDDPWAPREDGETEAVEEEDEEEDEALEEADPPRPMERR
jgi:hypothetical protein